VDPVVMIAPPTGDARRSPRLRLRAARAIAAIGGLLAGAVAAGCSQSPPSPANGDAAACKLPRGAAPPNIIFILVDTLRADRVGAYGRRTGLTPTIDRLAAEGVLFESTIAPAPWTLPSVASILTSLAPSIHKATSYRKMSAMERRLTPKIAVLDSCFTTLPEVLQAAGYQTAAFCANLFIQPDYGFGQGFDHFDGSMAANTVPGTAVNDALFRWLPTRDASKPLFLYLHYMDVHGPYNAAPEFMDPLMRAVEANPNKTRLRPEDTDPRRLLPYLRNSPPLKDDPNRHEKLKDYREYWVAGYEAGVVQVDHYLELLRAKLSELGLWDSSFVVLISDHGEALCEHGVWCHGYTQFHTDLHVPMILRWPGVMPAGRRVAGITRLIDLAPTILDQLHLAAPEGAQGLSLVGRITGRDTAPRIAYAEAIKAGPEQRAVYSGDWKLMILTQPAKGLLFNLANDYFEATELSASNGSQKRTMEQLIAQQLTINAQAKPCAEAAFAPVSEKTQKQLATVGYAGGDEAVEPDSRPAAATRPTTQRATPP
jgi:arylsulfatase A-like enzyme